ncbi:MAG: hypothetical protein WD556_06300 [Actinomycetota bacterium]
MSTATLPRPPAQNGFAAGSGPGSSRARTLLPFGLVLALILVVVETILLLSVNQAKGAAVAAHESAEAELRTAHASVADAEGRISSLTAQNAASEQEVDRLRADYDELASSSWKVQAYGKVNRCLEALMVAYNAATFVDELGLAIENTFHSPSCTPAINSTDRDY